MATKSQMLNVNMNINADTSKAKQQIQNLQDSLTSLLNTTKGKGAFNLTEDLNDSIKGVALLKAQLQDATNVKTGKLDLSKFNQSLKESGMSLEKYRDLFSNMGKAGDRAFAQLATSITDAEIPLKRSSKLVNDLWTTLKNTAKWQLSSSIMHGFMGAVQSALYYTQDLNKSLNDIRIVTGYNTDQMAEFAKQANRAAKNLSTTTTDYTNASLIYYQQGLPEDEIAKRTEITIKMANAAGVSAEKVSDQMTAVWNNFAEGGENLEYYADVMTALGAATASSTDEIAAGLEKFAAVSGTIGLSYEYAAASLATITAETRQSADVVGNALKTLFSRIQGLNLGETLEDGTDLNKYSAALDKVGISIKDTSGNVKEMDTILDELGARWKDLAKDEQLAVAQTVAGVRQYTQLVALMDNWDTFKNNVTIAESSEGTVSQQAEIYAESWEAARNRVQAAAEGIYDSILNDKFFISVNNGFAEFLTGIENIIDGLGGMDGVLLLLGTTITKVFNKQISQGIKDLAYNFKMLTKSGQESMRAFQNKANTLLIDEMLGNDKNLKSNSANALKEQAKAQQAYLDNAPYMTEIQKQQADMFRDKQKMLIEEIQLLEEEGQQIERNFQKELKRSKENDPSQNKTNGKYFGINSRGQASDSVDQNRSFLELAKRGGELHGVLDKVYYSFDKIDKTNFQNIKNELVKLGSNGKDIELIFGSEAAIALKKFNAALEKVGDGTSASEEDLKKLQDAFNDLHSSMTNITGIENLMEKLESLSDVIGTDEVAAIKRAMTAFYEKEHATGRLAGKTQGLTTYTEKLAEAFRDLRNQSFTAIDGFVAFGSALGSLASAIQSVKGLSEVWNDDSLSDWEKALTIITTMSMVLVSIKSSFQTDDMAKMGAVFGKVGNAILNTGGAATTAAGAISKVGKAAVGTAEGGTTLAASLSAAGTSLGAVAVGAGVVIAVIAALGIGIYALVKHINRYKDAAKDAANAAQELSDASLETKNKLNDIKSAFDSYDTAKKALDECTRGTEEWNKQLQEVNDQALELLNTYPELMREANLFTRNDHGVLELNEVVKDNAIEKLESQSRSQQAANYLSSSAAEEAQFNLDLNEFKKDLNRIDLKYQTGEEESQVKTVELDSIINKENLIKLTNLTYEEFEKELFDILKKPNDMADNTWRALVDGLWSYQEEINKLGNSAKKIAIQLDNAAELIISENFKELEDAAEREVAKNKLQNDSQAYYDEIMKADKFRGNNFDWNRKFSINGEDKTLDDLWEVYANVKGIEGSLKQNAIRGWKGDKKIVYDDATTGKTEEINMEAFASVVSAQLALEALGVSAENATNALNKISNTEEGEDFKNFIGNKDFSQMTEENLNKYSSESGTIDYLKTVFGLSKNENFTEYFEKNSEAMKALGFETAEEMIEDIQNGIEGQSEALNSVGEGLVKTVRNSYNEAIEGMSDSLNTQDHQKIGQMLTDVFVDSGAEGLEKVSDMLGGLGESADEFMGALEDIDWNTVSLDELKASLESAGVETDGLDGALQILIDSMNKTEEATLSLADAQGKHAGFQELGDLEMGDTISQEQMKSMTDVNPALAQYFQLMGDGTYALVAKAEYFQGIIEDLSFAPLTDQLEYMQGQYEAMKTASEYDYSRIDNIGAFGSSQQMDVSTDIAFLKASGTQSSDQIKNWEARNSEKSLTGDDYAQIYSALKDCGQATADWDEKMQELANQMAEMQEAINFTAYKDHVEDLGLDFAATERYAQDLAEAMDPAEYDNVQEAARNLAIANQRLDRGLSSLASNWDDYSEKLQDTNRYSVEYTETLQALKTDIADVFNTDASLLSDNFIEGLAANKEQMIAIADGNMEVINSLRQAMSEEIVSTIRTRVEVDAEQLTNFDTWYNQFQANFPDLETGVFLNPESEYAFIEALNGMSKAAGMTRDEVNALLGSMGMSATLKTDYVDQLVEVPVYRTYTQVVDSTTADTTIYDSEGNPRTWTNSYPVTETFTYQSDAVKMMGKVPVTSVETVAADGTSSGGGIDILTGSQSTSPGSSSRPSIAPSQSNVYNPTTGKGGYTGNKKSSGGGGGGKKDPKTSDPKILDDEIDRYYDIDNALEKISRQLKKIQNQSDTLYGASKIAAMEHEVEVLREQEEAYRKKAEAARSFIDVDRQAMADLGYSVSFDSDGNISNYTELMTQAVNDLNAYKAEYNAMSAEQQETHESVLKSYEDRYDALKEAMQKYEDTMQTIRDAEDAEEEARLQRLAKNYEILTHELEYKLYNIESRMKMIDYYVNKMSDDFYSAGEALAILSGKTDEYFNTLNQYSVFIDKLESQYAAGEITQADYIDGLKESYDAILDNLEALQDLDDQMLEYYGETLEKAKDELEKYTNQIDHLNDVLDHYQNIMSLIGRETNYDQMGAILGGQAKIRKDSLDIARENYKMLEKEKEAILISLNSVEEGSSAWEVFKKQLDDITEALNEAEDEMLSRTEEWVESMKALLENDLGKAYQNLENSFTNGLGFDYLSDSMDRVRENSELLLTQTNKIYETNKLISSAQQKSDATTSKSSKKKLQGFIDETQALQDKNTLSKVELEIQQAKYDLLLAQIALEEAQNSKNRVRLQRDSEGNFNYVYTSDSEAISNAEADLADKENALYNIRLEAANSAGEMMVETAQRWADALYQVDLDWMNGVITSEEEWRRRRAEINQQYGDLMLAYQDNFNVATYEDAKIVKEAWVTRSDAAYPVINKGAQDWAKITEDCTQRVGEAFNRWQSVVDAATEVVGKDLDDTTEKVDSLTDASSQLKEEVLNEVLPAISSELDTVRDLTVEYAHQRDAILSLIDQYENLARSIQQAIDKMSELNSYEAPSLPDYSGSIPGGSWESAPPTSPSQGGGGGGGGNPGYNPDQPTTVKLYKFSASFNDNARCEGTGFFTPEAAQARMHKEASNHEGLKSGSTMPYMGNSKEGVKVKYTSYGNKAQTPKNLNQKPGTNMELYDTGGYTGSWGPEGKLATLHEKELVLNKKDTENMLSAIEIVRTITNQVENQSKYFAGLSSHITLPSIGDMSQIMEQTVKIDANFPNVEDRYEIEEAFKNLMNTASQFANRKRL